MVSCEMAVTVVGCEMGGGAVAVVGCDCGRV